MVYFFHVSISIILDILFGDPHWYPHPVRVMGKLCTLSEKITRAHIRSSFLAGLVTVFIVITTTAAGTYLLIVMAYSIGSLVGDIISIVLLYTTIAARDLLKHANVVLKYLTASSCLEKAREAVGQIVGRDTQALTREEVSKACIETVAENMVDGITAPLFFAILASLGAPFLNVSPIACSAIGAFVYKSVNTLDSMIGYKNELYLNFGRSGAILDDLVNFLPARMSGFCLIVAAFFLKLDYRGATRIFLRDRLHHSSPNAGHSEAAVAGALGIQLGGPSSYFGEIVSKSFLGENTRKIEPEDIKKAGHLVIVGSLLFFSVMIGVRFIFLYIFSDYV